MTEAHTPADHSASGPMRRIIMALLFGTVALLAIAVLLNRSPERTVSADFALTTGAGKVLTDRDMRGRPYAIFFGYTYCPDICPTTLARLVSARAAGGAVDRLPILFVSVDTRRDTPTSVGTYAAAFGPGVTGLTGGAAEIRRAAAGFGVRYRQEPDGSTISHSSRVFLMGSRGTLADVIDSGDTAASARSKLARLIASNAL